MNESGLDNGRPWHIDDYAEGVWGGKDDSKLFTGRTDPHPLIFDGGTSQEPLSYWNGREEVLSLIADGDHGILSELAGQILDQLENDEDEASG